MKTFQEYSRSLPQNEFIVPMALGAGGAYLWNKFKNSRQNQEDPEWNAFSAALKDQWQKLDPKQRQAWMKQMGVDNTQQQTQNPQQQTQQQGQFSFMNPQNDPNHIMDFGTPTPQQNQQPQQTQQSQQQQASPQARVTPQQQNPFSSAWSRFSQGLQGQGVRR